MGRAYLLRNKVGRKPMGRRSLIFLGKTLLMATLLTLVFSVIYNQPIRFRSKMTAYADSVYTLYPSSSIPDQIMLSPAEDPSVAIRINWRTSPGINAGQVQYGEFNPFGALERFVEPAELTVMDTPELKQDARIHLFSAALKGLAPGTKYQYRVGDASAGVWSGFHTFTTAPAASEGFSFVYLGDTQNNHAEFGRLLKMVETYNPEAAFYMVGGDLVEDGRWRYLWDSFAANTTEVFSYKPVAPTLGNHDYKKPTDNGLKYFAGLFNLPDNGQAGLPRGSNYSFKYENVYFIVLDSNNQEIDQTEWLEGELLKAGGSDFTVAMFHHPPYSPKGRDNAWIREQWLPLFDKYRVDLVLNGHDHSYLRTGKVEGGRRADMSGQGTVYVVATACSKFHNMEQVGLADKQLAETITYQKITIGRNKADKPVLSYQAFDAENHLVDSFTIESGRTAAGPSVRSGPADGSGSLVLFKKTRLLSQVTQKGDQENRLGAVVSQVGHP